MNVVETTPAHRKLHLATCENYNIVFDDLGIIVNCKYLSRINEVWIRLKIMIEVDGGDP